MFTLLGSIFNQESHTVLVLSFESVARKSIFFFSVRCEHSNESTLLCSCLFFCSIKRGYYKRYRQFCQFFYCHWYFGGQVFKISLLYPTDHLSSNLITCTCKSFDWKLSLVKLIIALYPTPVRSKVASAVQNDLRCYTSIKKRIMQKLSTVSILFPKNILWHWDYCISCRHMKWLAILLTLPSPHDML